MTASVANPSRRRFSSLAVPWPVLLVAGLMFAGLVAVSGAYGFHGDEMYVHGARRPLQTETAFPCSLFWLMARDLGGSRRAQVLAAITAALSGYLAELWPSLQTVS